MHAPHRSWPLALMALAVLLALPATASAADLHATPATFSSVFAGAQGGDRVLLASGSYGNWGGGAKAAPGVTIAPEPGAAPTFSGARSAARCATSPSRASPTPARSTSSPARPR